MRYTIAMPVLVLALADPAATHAVGRALGAALRGGDVVALVGDLGAGKTTLVAGVVAGAGGDAGAVASPTFALVHDYRGPLAIGHVDLYRLERDRDVDELGLDELWARPDGATLVEWADKFWSRLPADRLEVELTYDGDARRLTATARGPAAVRLLDGWRAALAPRLG